MPRPAIGTRVKVNLPLEVVEEVQTLADEAYEGNFSMAVRTLLREALAARRKPEIDLDDYFAPAPAEVDTKLIGERPLDHFHPGGWDREGDVRPERGADPFATH